MKYSEMSPKQLRKRAKKLGVDYDDTTSDKTLIKRIKKAKAAATTPPADLWPAEWPAENRGAYYHQIVGEPMPKDEGEAYQRLQAVIEEKARDAEPVRMTTGFSCFGLYHRPDLKQCNMACLVMPLCQKICATRPDLVDQVKQLEQAAQELEQAAKAQPKAEKKPQAEAKAKKQKAEKEPKPKKAKKATKSKAVEAGHYEWVGDLAAYDTENISDDEAATLKVFKWMAKKQKGKPRRFTVAELAQKMTDYYEGDCLEAAAEMVEVLLGQEDLKSVGAEAAA